MKTPQKWCKKRPVYPTAAVDGVHGRRLLPPPSPSPTTPSLLRNNTCIASTMPCVFQTLDGFLISGVLSAPHMFEPAPSLSTIPKMPLTISWILVSGDTSCTPLIKFCTHTALNYQNAPNHKLGFG